MPFPDLFYLFSEIQSTILTNHTGYAATLEKEISQFGISTIDFYLGHFRTPVIGKMDVKICAIPDYQPMFQYLVAAAPGMDGTQPGDVEKGVKRMVDVLKGQGFAAGKTMPARLPIGKDALGIVRESCQAMLSVCEEWEELVASTDREGSKEGAWATGDSEYVR